MATSNDLQKLGGLRGRATILKGDIKANIYKIQGEQRRLVPDIHRIATLQRDIELMKEKLASIREQIDEWEALIFEETC